ncbi:MAG: hypothetical protein QM723_03855 [Myxococcaceae bacterium]
MRWLWVALLPSVAFAGPLDPFADPDAGFSVMFPGAPDRADHTQIVHGAPTVTHVYTSDTEKVGYAVSWSDHPEAAGTTPEVRLQAARDSALGPAKPVNETTGKLEGKPMRRVTFEKDGARVTLQLVLDGSRLYQAMVIRPAGEDHETAANTFLDSFALTARAKATGPSRPATHPLPPPPPKSRPDAGSPR